MIGQRILPKGHHAFAELRPEGEGEAYVRNVAEVIAKYVKAMPMQAQFIAEHCAAGVV